MQERHYNHLQYFEEQGYTTQKYVIPYIGLVKSIGKDSTVLEIGCGEGGNLKPFLDLGCKITGIDLSQVKIEQGNLLFENHTNRKHLTLICDDIYNRSDLGKFDIVILRDVIEHLPNQDFFMGYLKNFLHEKSVVYFGFPPWQNPFGGHQQVCSGKFLSRCPYFHLLPEPLFRVWMSLFGESQETVNGLLEVKETGISIERFERILKKNGYSIENRTLYLVNPNYEIKFHLKPRRQNVLIASLPWVRNFFTTAAYYLISNKNP
jgi:SAM-dependent methyltransferase